MNYQTMINDAIGWAFSDITHLIGIVAIVAIIGAANGIRCSFNNCKGRAGRIL